MSIQEENDSYDASFWEHANTYVVSDTQDEEFVSEMAYVMVTLHCNGS